MSNQCSSSRLSVGIAGAAVAEPERLALGVDGVVLPYGRLHGRGNRYEPGAPEPPRIDVEHAARGNSAGAGRDFRDRRNHGRIFGPALDVKADRR